MRAAFLSTGFATSAYAFTGLSDPLAPGNLNFPSDAMHFSKPGHAGLPEINVLYRFPPAASSGLSGISATDARIGAVRAESDLDFSALRGSFLKDPQDDMLAAMSRTPLQSGGSDLDATDTLIGLDDAGPASFLSGDDEPRMPSVLNLAVEVPEATSGRLFANEQMGALSALSSSQSREASELAALVAKNHKSFVSVDDKHKMNQIDQALMADCGDKCVTIWHKLLDKHQTGGTLSERVQDIMKSELEEGEQFFEQLNRVGQTSFLKWNPVNSPCADSKSCAAMSAVANKCTIARTAALAAYQAVNLATHVFAIVAKIVCGCLDVANASVCLLGTFLPACPPIHNVYGRMLSQSRQTWDAVVGLTDKCKTIGDIRATVMK